MAGKRDWDRARWDRLQVPHGFVPSWGSEDEQPEVCVPNPLVASRSREARYPAPHCYSAAAEALWLAGKDARRPARRVSARLLRKLIAALDPELVDVHYELAGLRDGLMAQLDGEAELSGRLLCGLAEHAHACDDDLMALLLDELEIDVARSPAGTRSVDTVERKVGESPKRVSVDAEHLGYLLRAAVHHQTRRLELPAAWAKRATEAIFARLGSAPCPSEVQELLDLLGQTSGTVVVSLPVILQVAGTIPGNYTRAGGV